MVMLAALAAALSGGEVFAKATASEASPARAFFAHVRATLQQSRRDATEIARVAEGVADKFIAARKFYIAPTQDSFLYEFWGRAGGPTGVAKWEPSDKPMNDCILLLPVKPVADHPAHQTRWINAAVASSATVVAFGSPSTFHEISKIAGGRFAAQDFYALIDNHTDDQQFTCQSPGVAAPTKIDTSSLVNLIHGWMFIGELTGACTRRDAMPVYWLSFGVDEHQNFVRARKYSTHIPAGKQYGPQKTFHDDLTVPAVKAGKIAEDYIDRLIEGMDQLDMDLWPQLEGVVDKAVAKLGQGHRVFIRAIGHAMPWEVPASQRDDTLVLLGDRWRGDMKKFDEGARPGDLLIVVGMPSYQPTTRQLVRESLDKGVETIVLTRDRPTEPELGTPILQWIVAPWPSGDAAVELPGYDVRILPITGILNPVIYYAMRLETKARLATSNPSDPQASP